MSSILLTWLNTEVDLSKKITNIEADFANGYLLGELLHKFNQLTNIYDFRDDNNRSAKLSNFAILHEVLHNVGVKFSPNTAEAIMDEKKGVVSNLLYEIRSNLEKKGVNPENISLKKSSHFQEMYSPMKFRQEIPPYDSFQNKHFLDSLQRKIRSQKEVDLEKKLKRFEDFKKQQDEKIAQARVEEEYQRKVELDTQIKNHRNKNQRYHAFLQQFEEKGINNWKNNMVKTKEREIKDLNFQLNEANKIGNGLKRAQKAIADEYIKNVRHFEANVLLNQAKTKKEDVTDNASGSNLELMETSSEQCPFQSVVLKCGPVISRIKTDILLNPSTKTERTRRRRKIIVEQSKAQLEIENKRRETQYTQKLNKQANQEKQLTYECYRVSQSKNIIMENRNLRDEMYLERLEQDKKFLQINEEDFLKYNGENNKREMDKEEQRKKDLYISLKQKERNGNSEVCKRMIALIIDIADEAYIYQQINDTEDVDDRVWREWTNVFINNLSVLDKAVVEEDIEKDSGRLQEGEEVAEEEEHEQIAQDNQETDEGKKEVIEKGIVSLKKSKYNNTFYSIFNADSQCTKLDSILDECEFFDYVNYNGQWDTILIPDSALVTLTPQDLIFDYIAPASQADPNAKKDTKAAAKNVNAQKGGNPKDNTEDLLKEDEPENLIIPKENIKNVFFGDLIDVLVEMRYEEESQSKSEDNKLLFRYIPIKIAIIGQDFSGKKTQAKILSENFPFKIYNFEHMVKSALELLCHKSETSSFICTTKDQIKDNDQDQSDKADEITQMRNEQAQEEAKLARIKELATEIKELLLNGEPISDQIYGDLLIEYVKKDFPLKEDSEVKKEIIERVQQKEDLLADIKENIEINSNRPKAFEKKDQELNQQLMKLSLEGSKGFIVVNYPNTFRQAKLLEMKLSGYIPESESHQLESNILKKAFDIVLDKSPKIIPPVKLLQGGFDYVFYLDVPSSECVRRAVGRRVYTNQKGETTIYHLEDNPPPTTSNICEKLVKVKGVSNCESTLITRHLAFDTAINQIIEFYQPFGFEHKQLRSFQRIDGAKGKEYVTHDLVNFVNQLVQINEEKDKEIYDKAQEEEEEDDSMQDLNINKEISELNDKSDNNIMKDADNIENDIALVDSPTKKDKDKDKDQTEKQETELEPYDAYVQKIQSIKAALNKDLSVVLLKIWTEIYENYVTECKSIFKFLRVQRDSISSNYNIICQKYIEFLKRPSKKQILLLDYQMKYNKFLDDYPDLKDDPQVKEEHHQEVDDLNDKIYEIIETRKNEAVDERKKIMTSGWIENEMEKFYMALERLFQNEIDKFIGSMQIMRDYYHNLDNRPLIELPFTTIDIIKEEIDPTPIEQIAEGGDINKSLPDSYPRVEKLYKTSLKVQFQYEEAIRESERLKAEKGDGNKKAQPAKNVKKGPAQPQQTEEVKEVFQHGDELRKALNNEKAKYKYKITLLKYWGLTCLKNVRKLSLAVYSKLEDWIILAIKAENEALNQLTNMLKDNIETETKIKYELALETFDVIVNMDVQNYIELPPKPLPAKEVIDHSKFNIAQLRILLEELETYLVEDTRNLRSSTFISIFIKKFIASRNDNDVYYGIPDLLKKLSYHNYFKFLKKLDPDNTDFVSLNQVITYFGLLKASIPKESDIKAIVAQLEKVINYYESPECAKEQFVSLKFWFDSNENSETLPNHEDYKRSEKLKEVLFDVNQEDNTINMNTFISILNLNCINLEYEKYEGKNYYEVLFF